jgi:hypothetical protein
LIKSRSKKRLINRTFSRDSDTFQTQNPVA